MIEAHPDNAANIIEKYKIGWSPITTESLVDAINGDLVTDFKVAGTLKGEKAAIYISPNALVKNINILQSADIQGDIISDWNPNEIIYQNEDAEETGSILKPALPYTENGMTHLNFGYTYYLYTYNSIKF